jgi:hypothetical protein
MGWSSGSALFGDVISVIKPNVPDKKVRKKMYLELIASFEDADWDTLDECLGEDDVYDEIYNERYGEL